MVGLVGRSSFLLNCRLGQYSRRCSVVSAGNKSCIDDVSSIGIGRVQVIF